MTKNVVWIFEDEVDLVDSYEEFLGPSYTLIHFKNKDEVHKNVDSSPAPMVIVLDLHIPYVETLALMAKLRQRFPATPIIVASATPMQSYHQEQKIESAFAYFEKPFDIERLVLEIKRGAFIYRIAELNAANIDMVAKQARLAETLFDGVFRQLLEMQKSGQLKDEGNNSLDLRLAQIQEQKNAFSLLMTSSEDIKMQINELIACQQFAYQGRR